MDESFMLIVIPKITEVKISINVSSLNNRFQSSVLTILVKTGDGGPERSAIQSRKAVTSQFNRVLASASFGSPGSSALGLIYYLKANEEI
jgi:hypothetical protein